MLQICSLYPKKLWVSIMYYEPSCSADFPGSAPWERKGWWSLTPGQCKVVFAEDLADVNRYFCYYAEASDSSAKWSGPYKRWVRDPVFTFCDGAGFTGPQYKIGYRLLDIEDYDDYTLTLIP